MTVSVNVITSDSCTMKFVRDLREKQGLSRADLSQSAGIKEGTLRAIERGTVRVDLDILCKLRRALGLTWEALGRLIEREVESSDK